MLGKKLINAGPVSSGANTFASENFNTVLYTGNGGTQRIGGYINRGAVFNGSSSYITIPIDKLTNTFSFSVWLYLDNLSTSYRWVFGNWNSTAQDLYVMIRDTGKIEVNPDGNNGTVEFGSSGAFTTNTWHHLAVSMDAGTYTVYLDGSSLGSGSTTNTTFDNGYNYQIGKTPNSSINEWSGKMDQFRLFDKAISSSEITTLYNETHSSTTISTTDIFDDNSGVALYQLDGNANDTGGASGKFGSGAIFNGSSSYITLGATNQFASSTVSISFWVNPATISTNYILLGNGNGGSFADGDNDIFLRSDGYIGYELGQSSSIYEAKYSTTTQLTANTWNHITLTYDSSLGTNITQVYVNGVQQSLSATYAAGGTFSGDIFIGTLNYHIGKRNLSTLFFDGRIDDVRIYSDVLTSTEVGYLYNNTTASIPTDNLEAYYKLDGDARDEQQLYDGTATNVTYAYDGTASNVTYQEATKFSPDLIWIKQRTGSAANHLLFDSIRGAHKQLNSNTAFAETDRTSADKGVTSFDSNGFTVKDTSAGDYEINGPNGGTYSGDGTYAAWCFNAGDGSSASNTDGSITSTVKANQDAGFSIVKWTTTSAAAWNVGHGLDTAPEMIISKTSSFGNSWEVYHKDLGTGKFLQLHTTAAAGTDSGAFSSVTDTTWTSYTTNTLATYIAYCFHSVDGYSKVGSYTGNGSTSGPIVETGFEPAFIMMKATDLARNWVIVDNKRGYGNNLSANTSLAEYLTSNGQGMEVQFLSNGFQIETTSSWINNDTTNYIYLAIAADPDTTTPTVENSFDVVTYTGNNGTQEIATDFKPDLVWIKHRNHPTAHSHNLVDSVRGATKLIYSNTTDAEETITNSITSFDSNGFTIGNSAAVNGSPYNYVAWCWKAGDHDDNLPQINTEGTIDSTVSVNAEAGFSIVKGTAISSGAFTVGHGLSQAPEFYVIKNTSGTGSWIVYTSATGAGQYLILNSTDAAASSTLFWNNTAPSSTVFQMNAGQVIAGGADFIAYCFHSVTGYQKIGSYNIDSSDPQTITTGFQPRFVMLKNIDYAGGSWYMYDNLRRDSAEYGYRLFANNSNAESASSAYNLDFTSNGFTVQGTGVLSSGSSSHDGNTVIYMAIK